jgi:hypothetical protein
MVVDLPIGIRRVLTVLIVGIREDVSNKSIVATMRPTLQFDDVIDAWLLPKCADTDQRVAIGNGCDQLSIGSSKGILLIARHVVTKL